MPPTSDAHKGGEGPDSLTEHRNGKSTRIQASSALAFLAKGRFEDDFGGLIMRTKSIFFAVLALNIPSVIAAHPIQDSKVTVGQWSIGGFTDDATGVFSHCAASVRYRNGISLAFSISSGAASWRMGLSNPAWKLPAGHKYPLSYTVDGRTPANDRAIVATPQLIMWELPVDGRLFGRFRAGRLLTVGAAGDTFNFGLLDSSKALSSALACATYYQKNPPQQAGADPQNPFRTGSGVPKATKTEAATVLVNLLGAAGIQGFRLLPEVPERWRYLHVAFEAPGVIGGVRIQTASTVQDTTAVILVEDERSCDGAYATTRERSEQGVVSVWSACRAATGGGIAVLYVLAPRAAGGVYVFSSAQLSDGATSGGMKQQGPAAAAGKGLFEASLKTLGR